MEWSSEEECELHYVIQELQRLFKTWILLPGTYVLKVGTINRVSICLRSLDRIALDKVY